MWGREGNGEGAVRNAVLQQARYVSFAVFYSNENDRMLHTSAPIDCEIRFRQNAGRWKGAKRARALDIQYI